MNEELVGLNEALHPAALEKISANCRAPRDKAVFRRHVTSLIKVAQPNDRPGVCEALSTVQLDFAPLRFSLSSRSTLIMLCAFRDRSSRRAPQSNQIRPMIASEHLP